jgi:hypothetical protein
MIDDTTTIKIIIIIFLIHVVYSFIRKFYLVYSTSRPRTPPLFAVLPGAWGKKHPKQKILFASRLESRDQVHVLHQSWRFFVNSLGMLHLVGMFCNALLTLWTFQMYLNLIVMRLC